MDTTILGHIGVIHASSFFVMTVGFRVWGGCLPKLIIGRVPMLGVLL